MRVCQALVVYAGAWERRSDGQWRRQGAHAETLEPGCRKDSSGLVDLFSWLAFFSNLLATLKDYCGVGLVVASFVMDFSRGIW